jgi:citrate lyase subunit beta/citryl-CoA lyase
MGADGVLIVQTHSQSVFETRAAISRMLDMPLDKVRLQHVQGAGCYGHNMADDAAADVALLAAYLEAFEQMFPAVIGEAAQTAILPIVTETAEALAGLNSYKGASPRLAGLMWGAEDLAGDIGALTNKDEEAPEQWTSPFGLVRNLCLFAAAAAGVPAIDTVPTELNNPEALLRETRRAYRDGFSAKAAIHPGQVPVINQAMTPDAQAQEWAQRVIAAFAANTSVGVATLDGKMLDTPHLRLAKKIAAATQLA